MAVDFFIKYFFFIIEIKKISETKNKSINEKYLVCYYNKKKTQLSCSKLGIICKIKLSGDSLTFSLSCLLLSM